MDETQANREAQLLNDPTDDGFFPALSLPLPEGYPHQEPEDRVLVFARWSDGELVITVDSEDARDAEIPVRVNVNNDFAAYRAVITP